MEKVAIVTSAKEFNYGAILQAFALQSIIQRIGYNAELLWWKNQKNTHRDIRLTKIVAMLIKYLRHPSIFQKSVGSYKNSFEKDITEASKLLFEKFEESFLNIEYLSYMEMKRFAYSEDCKAIIAGSDQIWNSYAVYVDPFYYLRFAPQKKRVAYAPSLGKNDIPQYNKKIMKKYISEFKALSVRELSGKKIVDSLISGDIPVMIDPSFLFTNIDWECVEADIQLPQKYVLLYFLDQPRNETINHIKKLIPDGYDVIALPYKYPEYSHIKKIAYVDAGPSEFLTLIKKAHLVITDSFHGTAFSINYNKEFYTFNRQYGSNQSQASRITDLLQDYGLIDRFITNASKEISYSAIKYDDINTKLEQNRREALKYLKESIML